LFRTGWFQEWIQANYTMKLQKKEDLTADCHMSYKFPR